MSELFVYDAEADDLLEGATKLHCMVFSNTSKTKIRVFCDYTSLPEGWLEDLLRDKDYQVGGLVSFKGWLKSGEVNGLVCHNQFSYDLPLLEKLGYIDSFDLNPDKINNTPIKLIDSLALSRHLHPDRQLPVGCPTSVFNPVTKKLDKVGAHGLMSWAYRTGGHKPVIHDWRNQSLETYLERCIDDVDNNVDTYKMLLKEASDHPINGSWDKSLTLANQTFFGMCKQERTGVPFDEEKAWKLVERIDGMMKEIEEEVEPQLPMRILPNSKQPNFPSKPFKEDGTLSTTGWNWIIKLGYPVHEASINPPKIPANPFKQDGTLSANGKKWFIKEGVIDLTSPQSHDNLKLCREYLKEIIASSAGLQPLSEGDMKLALRDIKDKKQIILEEPMTLGNQDDLKKWLVRQGWKPTLWGTKDATVNSKKRNRTEQETLEIIEKYIATTRASVYKYFIMDELGINFDRLSDSKITDKLLRKARFLPTSPQFKDERGELCPNLEKLDGELAKNVVKWLSLRNRRGVLKALDEKKSTGWLNNNRLKVDGRLPAGASGLTNTKRMKHRTVVNCPKAAPDVLLGKEMRELFYAPKGYLFLGFDMSGLEARVAAMYAWNQGGDGGEYANTVLGNDGSDYHTENAKLYTKVAGVPISRSQGKNVQYATLYGATPPKIAKMLGIGKEQSEKVVETFWNINHGLKRVKDKLEKYWEMTGKKYIVGLDGGKVYTRSKHSLMNCLFQNAGATITDMVLEKLRVSLRDEGVFSERVMYVHDEQSSLILPKDVQFVTFDTEEEADEFEDVKIWSAVQELERGGYARYYHRAGEMATVCARGIGEEIGSKVMMDAEYKINRDWSGVH